MRSFCLLARDSHRRVSPTAKKTKKLGKEAAEAMASSKVLGGGDLSTKSRENEVYGE